MLDVQTLRTCFAEIAALQDDGVAFFGPSFDGSPATFDPNKLYVEVLDSAEYDVVYRVTRIFGGGTRVGHNGDVVTFHESSRWCSARLAASADLRLPTLRQAVAMQRLPTTAFPQPGSIVSYKGVACTVRYTSMSGLLLMGLGFNVQVPLYQFLVEQGKLT